MERCESKIGEMLQNGAGRSQGPPRRPAGYSIEQQMLNLSMPPLMHRMNLNDTFPFEQRGSSRANAEIMDLSLGEETPLTDDPITQGMDEGQLKIWEAQKRKHGTYKTSMCRAVKEYKQCQYGDSCTFAHSVQELRETQARGKRHPKYKTQLCSKFSETGFCRYGDRCQYIHHLKNQKLIDHRKMKGIALDANLRPEMMDSPREKLQATRPLAPLMERLVAPPANYYEEKIWEQSRVRRQNSPRWPIHFDLDCSLPNMPIFEASTDRSTSHTGYPTANGLSRSRLTRDYNLFD